MEDLKLSVSIVSNRLKVLRERSRLTQKEVAKILGVNDSIVSRHENSERSLTARYVRDYAQIYKVDTWEIFMDPQVYNEIEDALNSIDITDDNYNRIMSAKEMPVI